MVAILLVELEQSINICDICSAAWYEVILLVLAKTDKGGHPADLLPSIELRSCLRVRK